MSFAYTPHHPLLTLPSPEQAALMGHEKWAEAMMMREKTIRDEQALPLWKCWEPPIWKVCDALWGAPWLPEAEAAAIRENLGFSKAVSVLYLLGAQRSSKTEYAANRITRIMDAHANGLSWMFHNTMSASIDAHQKLIWKYLPANLRGKPILSQTTYIAYKDKTGFSDGSMVRENLHKLRFLSYDMPLTDLQGLNLRAVAADEFVSPEHVETFKARVAVLNGVVFIMLAPITGYTPLVQSASDGAEVKRSSIAFLNPADGGPRHVGGYLGLEDPEVEELRAWLGRRMQPPFPNVPFCRPERCSEWLTGGSGQMPIPEGRKFKMVPRVQKPVDPEEKSAIVHFHGGDNPYGNPLSLYLLNTQSSEEQGNRIFYGLAKKGMTRKFPKFSRDVHTLPASSIPKAGTNYLWVDPCGGRNFFMTWIRFTGAAAYVYREWPGNYEIPGFGVPGPWALPDGKLHDGRMGPAQESFGFGLLDYKRELARLERWKDADRKPARGQNDTDWVKAWQPESGAAEVVVRRFLDSRYASSPTIENDRPVTLLEKLADIGLHFETTPGDDIDEGVALINDWFNYDQARPVEPVVNAPRLFISRDCRNTIFAIETWRNAEKGRGATKDPIDNLRYATLQGVDHLSADTDETQGGGSY